LSELSDRCRPRRTHRLASREDILDQTRRTPVSRVEILGNCLRCAPPPARVIACLLAGGAARKGVEVEVEVRSGRIENRNHLSGLAYLIASALRSSALRHRPRAGGDLLWPAMYSVPYAPQAVPLKRPPRFDESRRSGSQNGLAFLVDVTISEANIWQITLNPHGFP
jgi:hypothetical protein